MKIFRWVFTIQDKIAKAGIRFQLLLGYLACILIPFLLFGGLMLRFSYHQTLTQSRKAFTQTTEQINMVLDEYTKQIDKISLGFYGDDEISDYLHDSFINEMLGKEFDKVSSQDQVFKKLEEMLKINTDVWSISVVTMNGDKLTLSHNGYEREKASFLEDPYYKPLLESSGSMIVLPLRSKEYYFTGSKEVFTIARKFMDAGVSEGKTPLLVYSGYILMECEKSVLDQICQNVKIGQDGFVVILDAEQEIFYHSDKVKKEDLHDPLLDQPTVVIGGDKWMSVRNVSQATGLTVVGLIPLSEVEQGNDTIFKTLTLLCFICVLAVLAASAFLSRSFIKPIKALQSSMLSFQQGDMDACVTVNSHNEFGELGRGFNDLTRNIKQLTASISVAEQKKKEMEMSLLYSQIDPHFLYNTLDSIRMLSLENDDAQTAQAILALADLFRYTTKQKKDYVQIRNEVMHVQNYIYIQKLRYSDRFEVCYELDEGLFEHNTIPFILQPIVENAILHGFERVRKGGLLKISIYLDGDRICFSIEDNGAGMEEETFQALKERLSHPDLSNYGEHIGLSNINQRLILYFGSSSALQIVSRPNEGTRVWFTIPIVMNQGEGISRIINQIDDISDEKYDI